MSGALVGAAAVAIVGATGLVVATTMRLPGPAHLLLAAYLVAFTEVVGLTLLLSAFGAVTRTGVLLVLVATWRRRSSPGSRSERPALHRCRSPTSARSDGFPRFSCSGW